uniref:Uncharacterized protein n=1 Tax=Aegilops tauschii subsp. strangulata TaxID=200361 RepID=A0A453S9Z8_AEGTS
MQRLARRISSSPSEGTEPMALAVALQLGIIVARLPFATTSSATDLSTRRRGVAQSGGGTSNSSVQCVATAGGGESDDERRDGPIWAMRGCRFGRIRPRRRREGGSDCRVRNFHSAVGVR